MRLAGRRRRATAGRLQRDAAGGQRGPSPAGRPSRRSGRWSRRSCRWWRSRTGAPAVGGRHPAGPVDRVVDDGSPSTAISTARGPTPAISIVVPAPPPRVRPSSGHRCGTCGSCAPGRALAAPGTARGRRARGSRRPTLPNRTSMLSGLDVRAWLSTVIDSRRPDERRDGARQSRCSAATCSTVRPGDHVGGHVATVASRSASTTAKLGAGVAAPTRPPSASRRRGRCAWVRSRVSRSDSERGPGRPRPGEAVAATLARQVAAES